MLWRVRTTLEDRPGALAELAARCGKAGVNILGLRIFPGVDSVTDELVLRAPYDWGMADVAEMVERAGGVDVTVATCTAHALVDDVTRYLQTLRQVSDDPAAMADALTALLDGEPASDLDPLLATLDVEVGGSMVTVRRTADFTATEEARAQAFAGVVDALLRGRGDTGEPPAERDASDQPRVVAVPDGRTGPHYRVGGVTDAPAIARMAQRCSVITLADRFGVPLAGLQPRMARRLLTEGAALVAEVDGEIVGLATVAGGRSARATLLVEDGWQGRGVGSRLLRLAAGLAKAHGADELVLASESNRSAVPRLSAAAGLTGRIRDDGERVVLTVSLRRMKPWLTGVEGAAAFRPLDPAPA